MTRVSHTIKGKTTAVFITPDGSVINANIKDLTIHADDHDYDDYSWGFATWVKPVDLEYSLEGKMVEVSDNGTIFEVRSPV